MWAIYNHLEGQMWPAVWGLETTVLENGRIGFQCMVFLLRSNLSNLKSALCTPSPSPKLHLYAQSTQAQTRSISVRHMELQSICGFVAFSCSASLWLPIHSSARPFTMTEFKFRCHNKLLRLGCKWTEGYQIYFVFLFIANTCQYRCITFEHPIFHLH